MAFDKLLQLSDHKIQFRVLILTIEGWKSETSFCNLEIIEFVYSIPKFYPEYSGWKLLEQLIWCLDFDQSARNDFTIWCQFEWRHEQCTNTVLQHRVSVWMCLCCEQPNSFRTVSFAYVQCWIKICSHWVHSTSKPGTRIQLFSRAKMVLNLFRECEWALNGTKNSLWPWNKESNSFQPAKPI